jgi:hypothetical protein
VAKHVPSQPPPPPKLTKKPAPRSSSGTPAPSTQSTVRLSSNPKKTPKTTSPAKGSALPARVTTTSPTPPRNINDGSYESQSAPLSTSGPSTRINEQMQAAKGEAQAKGLTKENITARQQARAKLMQRGPKHGLNALNPRAESTHRAAFDAGRAIEHRRDPTTGHARNQEPGRMASLPLNQRPSQRQHAAPTAPARRK